MDEACLDVPVRQQHRATRSALNERAGGARFLAGPRGMDPGLVRALHEVLNAALHDPAHLAVLQRLDMPLRPMNPAAYTAFVHRQFEEDRAMFRALEMGRQ